jgi:very-short-patch-repair endonuclease
MRSLHADVHRRGGIATTAELLRDGHTSHELTGAVRRGDVLRVRQGHYACPELPAAHLEAYRVGGRLTGSVGAREHGIWVPHLSTIDIQVRPDARALRTRTDPNRRLAAHPDPLARVHWTDGGRPGTRTLAGPVDCLASLLTSGDPRTCFASVESALRGGVITRVEWRRLLGTLPLALAAALSGASRASESGGESLLLFDLRRAGIRPRQQVRITGVGRVDLLIGERLIIEVDGAEFHTERRDFEEDRRRDAVAAALGYRTLRFSHTQVERGDAAVLAAIRAAMARRDHE